jgi:hypothetical protein
MGKSFFVQAQKDLRAKASWAFIKRKMTQIPKVIPRAWGLAKRLRYPRKQK